MNTKLVQIYAIDGHLLITLEEYYNDPSIYEFWFEFFNRQN